jgi:hypothetical protein
MWRGGVVFCLEPPYIQAYSVFRYYSVSHATQIIYPGL